ncbi:acetate--CoA ligase family protein [Roseibium sediminis]|uniref:acetate--CoA ligase family protein n=1 Tax=Roseibium sediminis TaxID=1775174 RepID=UPI00123C8490|nr:acetate--CoA ligase family protein [Roseibium sediminis]
MRQQNSPLDRLLRPKSIAVIGGGVWCEQVIEQNRKFGFSGEIWAVHPTRSEIAGIPAFSSLADLPHAPDAAFVGINRQATIEIVRDLAAKGAGGAICFASGFREASAELADGGDLQSALVEAAGSMAILGPNCYGLLNATANVALWPDQHGLVPVKRGVAIVSQSSNIAINLTMQARGLPIAAVVTVGNQAQTGLSRIGAALVEDEAVTAIGFYIEGLDDLQAFEVFAAKAKAAGKPVVALKIGRSAQAQAATISHTASLAGNSAGASALFSRLGIAEVRSLPVLLEALKIAHVVGKLPNTNIASLSCSGGEANLMADTAIGHSVSFPALSEPQKAGLRSVLGPKVALANPLDYHTYIWGNVDAMAETFAHLASGDASLALVILDFPRSDRCNSSEWAKVIAAVEAAKNKAGKPFGILSSLPETMPETIAQDLMARGIVPLTCLDDALAAIETLGAPPGEHSAPLHIAPSPENLRTLNEAEAKALLKTFGVRIPQSRAVPSASEAARAASDIGFPVVLKGTGIAHKTEAGAVALNLPDPVSVEKAALTMPPAGILVEEMITGTIAELLVGVVRDPAHGFVLTLAAGGVLTELLQDSVSLLVPSSRDTVHAALLSLKLSKLLTGYRGQPACDLEAILDTIEAVQACVMERPIEELEINPLLCGADFAIAADALIRCGGQDDG